MGKKLHVDEKDVETIRSLWDEGYTISEIASKLNTTYDEVRTVTKHFGLSGTGTTPSSVRVYPITKQEIAAFKQWLMIGTTIAIMLPVEEESSELKITKSKKIIRRRQEVTVKEKYPHLFRTTDGKSITYIEALMNSKWLANYRLDHR